ncbi:hypothetical protein [Rubrivirga marina]|uniref:Lipoprotein n=1 Tax=Rubrivirga marina TaxID=1196024 RepID=A0A271J4N6_9BACT|nr:hypothetical protein [Rubrivirga marina]PAP78258.1 hypothetical protein BSZ37_18420 [Rubrivirga marina]
MRTALCLLAAALVWGCDAAGPVSPDTPALSPEEEAAYAEDATVLAFRYQLQAGDRDAVEIPDALVHDLADALIRARASEEGDLILGIRARAALSPVRLLVAVDPEAAWTGAWRAGATETGDAAVDALLDRYGLSLSRYLDGLDLAVLHSPTALNTVALAGRFAAVDGVRYAEPDGLAGDGDDISAVRTDDGWVLDFSRGSGDCPAGCIERTYWTFEVEPNTVNYLGSRNR